VKRTVRSSLGLGRERRERQIGATTAAALEEMVAPAIGRLVAPSVTHASMRAPARRAKSAWTGEVSPARPH